MKQNVLLAIFVAITATAFAQNKIDIDIKTGTDNLEPRDFMTNPSITLRIKNRADIVKLNINNGQTWANNSLNRVTFQIGSDIAVSDIYEIEITRKDNDGSKNNFEGTIADNWNIQKLMVTATFKEEGKTVKYKLLEKEGRPLVRFVYELIGRHNDNETSGSVKYAIDQITIISGAPAPTPTQPGFVIAKPVKLIVEIGTGGDDLRGGRDNLSIKIFLKNNPTPIQWKNVNAGRTWNNFSTRKAERVFNNILNFDDIEKIEMWHDGGGGFGADNWDVDKVLITAKIDDRQKILIDKTGTPLHRFTGDTRRKSFAVE